MVFLSASSIPRLCKVALMEVLGNIVSCRISSSEIYKKQSFDLLQISRLDSIRYRLLKKGTFEQTTISIKQ